MKNILIFGITFLLFSCKKIEKIVVDNNKTNIILEIKNESNKYELDSLFHGLILVKDKNFIYNLSVGGDGFEYFYDYENILKTINKKFAFWNNKIIRSTKINQHLTLELSRLKFNKKEIGKNIFNMYVIIIVF
jgi:hypothetical protein